jgi:hypothetical protein
MAQMTMAMLKTSVEQLANVITHGAEFVILEIYDTVSACESIADYQTRFDRPLTTAGYCHSQREEVR